MVSASVQRPRPGQSALRIGRCFEPGRPYFITTVAAERATLFADWAPAACMASRMAAAWPGCRLLCWVLMPDHWHGLVVPLAGASLSEHVRRAKGRSARMFNQAMGRRGPVWAPAFHDHALRRDEDLRAVARYIIANPLRAGLAERVGDYPFWDAAWLSGPEPL